MYDDVMTGLRDAYNHSAAEREKADIAPWKQEERRHFLSLLQAEDKRTLLEVGAGTGKDSLYFQQNGLGVTCIDASPEMVKLCRQKGLTAHVRDFLSLGFPAESFDALYALNCLLHVPKHDLPAVLQALRQVLRSGGLFYLGLYGGIDFEGVWPDDQHDPKRFYSYHTDDGIQQAVRPYFDVLSFKRIMTGRGPDLHFQSLLLRR